MQTPQPFRVSRNETVVQGGWLLPLQPTEYDDYDEGDRYSNNDNDKCYD